MCNDAFSAHRKRFTCQHARRPEWLLKCRLFIDNIPHRYRSTIYAIDIWLSMVQWVKCGWCTSHCDQSIVWFFFAYLAGVIEWNVLREIKWFCESLKTEFDLELCTGNIKQQHERFFIILSTNLS